MNKINKDRWVKYILIFFAFVIVIGSLGYMNSIMKQIAISEQKNIELWAKTIQKRANLLKETQDFLTMLEIEERQKMNIWAEATKRIIKAASGDDLSFYADIISSNNSIPILMVNENNRILASKNVNPPYDTLKSVSYTHLDVYKRQVSMVPAKYHILIAKDCLALSKHLFTASYISPEMKALDNEVKSKKLLFLNECGLDPGLDHMSAMKIINDIKDKDGEILEFESSTGGLVAPESDDNPWNYKFTWNPRNVVLAGMEPAKFLENGQYKYIPYHRIFQWTKPINISGLGDFEVYPNRDSLKYRFVYGLDNVKSMLRGTIRRPGYCKAWDGFVQLGITDDSYEIENIDKMTWRELIASYLPNIPEKTLEDIFCYYVGIEKNSPEFHKFEWLDIFTDKLVGLQKATPAQALQHLSVKISNHSNL